MPERIGQRLKMVRKLYGLSQRELAKRAGVANSAISVMEQDSVSPSVASLGKVLTGFPLSVTDFFSLELSSTLQVESSITNTGGAEIRLALTPHCAEKDRQPHALLLKQKAVIVAVSGSLNLSSLQDELSLAAGQQLILPAMTLCLISTDDISSHWVLGHLST